MWRSWKQPFPCIFLNPFKFYKLVLRLNAVCVNVSTCIVVHKYSHLYKVKLVYD